MKLREYSSGSGANGAAEGFAESGLSRRVSSQVSRAVITAADERYSLIVRTTLEVGRPSLTGPFTCFRIASS
jgi:hypothetical protein